MKCRQLHPGYETLSLTWFPEMKTVMLTSNESHFSTLGKSLAYSQMKEAS